MEEETKHFLIPNCHLNGYVSVDVVPTQSCDVQVVQPAGSVSMSSAVTYNISVTPNITDVTPRRGGTAGGTLLTITGSGFT